MIVDRDAETVLVDLKHLDSGTHHPVATMSLLSAQRSLLRSSRGGYLPVSFYPTSLLLY
jgi:hypothetical protein